MNMKKYTLLVSFFILSLVSFSQGDSTASPSSRFKIFPPAKFLLPDSATFFTKADLPKNKPILLMVFHPECDHCQHETEELTKNIEQFRNIQIVMATMVPVTEMKNFIEKYKLSQYDNIIVAQDVSFFLPPFFQFNNLPFLAFYNKKQKLIDTFSGSMKIEAVLKKFK
jgi:thiol-disulfide isomerase/thioredoxin